jgi:hypothetical protein
MKKILLSLAAASLALSATAQTVYFEEDFEWLAPWCEAGDKDGKPAGDCIGTNDPSVNSPQIVAREIEGKTVAATLEDKGYELLRYCTPSKTPGECIYINVNYLKFGKTGYQGGIVLPAMSTMGDGATAVHLSFDWCPQRQGSGVIDPTSLVVLVKNGEDEKSFAVPAHGIEQNGDLKWVHADIDLSGATFNKDTRITIRNIDDQLKSGKALRWHFDNVKVYAQEGSGVAGIEAEENAPVEYYNLQGIRVANPENGLYIVKQGNKVTKRVIK